MRSNENFESIYLCFVDKLNRLYDVNDLAGDLFYLTAKHKRSLRCSHQRFVVCLDMRTFDKTFLFVARLEPKLLSAKMGNKIQRHKNYWYWRNQRNWLLMETYVADRRAKKNKHFRSIISNKIYWKLMSHRILRAFSDGRKSRFLSFHMVNTIRMIRDGENVLKNSK